MPDDEFSSDERFKVLWAKSRPRHPLWKHLLDAAAFSLALPPLPNRFGLKDAEVAALVGLHDVGKASPQFQHKIPELSAEVSAAGFPLTADAECRHERLSADFVRELMRDLVDRRQADAVALAVAAHHGHWEGRGCPLPGRYELAQRQLRQLLWHVLRIDVGPSFAPNDLSALGMLLSGRVVLCDWLASNEGFVADDRLHGNLDPSAYFAAACEVARNHVAALGFVARPRPGRPDGLIESPRPVQRVLLEQEIPPGLVVIEAPMGEGKTEAAWILAEKWRNEGYRGMFMALPTMATSESLHRRYRESYLGRIGDGEDVKLVHGMAWLRDEVEDRVAMAAGETLEDSDIAASWFRPTRRAMLADHGVGTVDQAMLASMNVKFGFLRLYGLADRALVIDEVHAYDAYMSAILERLLRWCASLKIPVILLSATLSAAQRAAMVRSYGAALDQGDAIDPESTPYPLVTVVEAGGRARLIPAAASSTKTVRVECLEGLLGNPELTAARAAELVGDGGCCCVIVNTVKQAQAVYRSLDLHENEKLLFHARFKAADRNRVADRVSRLFGPDRTTRPARFVVVATQVAEQSLDVDFDHMITEIAPVDLLLQRSGRLHRHIRRDKDPILFVLTPAADSTDFGGTGWVYARKPLLRTLAILGGGGGQLEFRLPRDFRGLIERCYSTVEWDQHMVSWEDVRSADREWEKETSRLKTHARHFLLLEPDARAFHPAGNDPVGEDSDDGNGWRARTRLGAVERTAVLIPDIEAGSLSEGTLPMERVRESYRQSIRLPDYLPVGDPLEGFGAGIPGRGRLHGLLILPVNEQGVWRGHDEKGGQWEVRYDNTLGLLLGRV